MDAQLKASRAMVRPSPLAARSCRAEPAGYAIGKKLSPTEASPPRPARTKIAGPYRAKAWRPWPDRHGPHCGHLPDGRASQDQWQWAISGRASPEPALWSWLHGGAPQPDQSWIGFHFAKQVKRQCFQAARTVFARECDYSARKRLRFLGFICEQSGFSQVDDRWRQVHLETDDLSRRKSLL